MSGTFLGTGLGGGFFPAAAAASPVTPPAPTSEAVAAGGSVTGWTFSAFTDPDGRIASYSATLTAVVGSGSLSGSGLGPYSITGTADGDSYTVELDALDSGGAVLATATHSVAIAATLTPYIQHVVARLDGVSDYVSVPLIDTPQITDSFTVSAWIKTAGVEPIISIEESLNKGMCAFLSSSQLRLRFSTSASDYVVWSASGLPSNAHNHVLIAYNGSAPSMYVNGTLISSSAITSGTVGVISHTAAYIGLSSVLGATFYANTPAIEHVAYWNSDQSANVAAIFNNHDPPDLSALGTPPLAWWPMTHSSDDYAGTGQVTEIISGNHGSAVNFATPPVRNWREVY